MKKNILIVFILIMFVSISLGQRKVIRLKPLPDAQKAFVTKQLGLLGLKVGKVSIIGENGFVALIKGFTFKTNALKLAIPFKSFSLKGTLKRITRNSKAIIEDNKPAKGIIVNNRNATGPVIINAKNTKLLINKNQLLGANFIIDDNNMPTGIILQNKYPEN